jgi:predicted metal-dependent hydrolase
VPDPHRTLTIDGLSFQYDVRRSARRHRTVEVSVDRTGAIHVAAPMRMPQGAIEEFLARRRGWLQRQLAASATRQRRPTPGYATGDEVPFLGEALRLRVQLSLPGHASVVRRVKRSLEVALAPSKEPPTAAVATVLERWYRDAARDVLERRVAHFAERVAAPSSVLIRSQKHLWGSCSSDGVLRFNWRLVMAPLDVVDYVVVHELCHLRHPHHQKPFWDAVSSIMPVYRARRATLRGEGDNYRL